MSPALPAGRVGGRAGRLDTLMAGLALVTLLAGAAASWQFYLALADADRIQRREQVNTQARTVRDAFEAELGQVQAAVAEAANFVNFQSALSARSWHHYATQLMQRFPQLRQLVWAAALRRDDLSGLDQRLQAQGVAGFTLRGADGAPLAPRARPSYLAVVYTHPDDPAALGRDLFDRPAWSAAARTARDGGATVFLDSPPAGCSGAAGAACMGLLTASYAEGRPESISERRVNFQGVLIAVADYAALTREAVRRARAARLQLQVYDVGAQRRLAYSDPPQPAAPASDGTATSAMLSVIAADHAWELVLAPLPELDPPRVSRAAIGGGIGLACSLMLACVMVAVVRGIRAIAHARSAAEAATQAKTDFLANMSHEIRTPMNAILGMSHLAKKAGPSPRQRDYLNKIESAAGGLLEILNDILDFSKIEAGMMRLESVPFDLGEVLDKLVQICGMKADTQGLAFYVKLPNEVRRTVLGDPLRLGQILINFSTNALKFTERGRVIVAVSMEPDAGRAADADAELLWLRFTVTDTGIGLSPEQSARLFSSFSQADTSTTRKYGGTGLGLAICKRLAELMGGRVGMQSTLGQGSSFWAVLPMRRTVSPPPRVRMTEGLQGLSVLLVADDADAREVYADYLRSYGMHVRSVVNAVQAEAELKAEVPQLLLLDQTLEGFDAIAQRASLHADPQAAPHVLILTASADAALRERAMAAGIRHFLSKPIGPAALFDGLSEIFGVAAGAPGETPESLEQAARAQLSGRRILLADDHPINQQVAREILEDIGIAVVIAANGIEALAQVHASHLEHRPFDAILMDMQMPWMDGITATRELRSDPRNAGTPILAMTANVTDAARQACTDAGMNEHLSKPLNVPALFAALMRCLPSGAQQPAARPAGPPAGPPADPPAEAIPAAGGRALDTRLGLARTGGKAGRYREVLLRFQADEADTPERIVAALLQQATETAQREAHTLAGLAATIGALDLQLITEQLEDALDTTAPAAAPARDPHWQAFIGPLKESHQTVLDAIAQELAAPP